MQEHQDNLLAMWSKGFYVRSNSSTTNLCLSAPSLLFTINERNSHPYREGANFVYAPLLRRLPNRWDLPFRVGHVDKRRGGVIKFITRPVRALFH